MTPLRPVAPIIKRTVSLKAGTDLNKVAWASGTRYVVEGRCTGIGNGINLPSDIAITNLGSAAGVFDQQLIEWKAPTSGNPHVFNVPATASRVWIEGLKIQGGNIVALSPEGSDITLKSLSISDGQLWLSRNAQRMLVSKCVATAVLPMYFGYFDEQGFRGNSDITIERCATVGMLGGHGIRMYGSKRVLITGCQLRNPSSIKRPPGWVVGQSLKLCDVDDCEVRNCELDTCQFGPNGQYEPFPVAVTGLKLSGNHFNDRVNFTAGCTGVEWTGGTIVARSGGSCAWVKAYTGRPTPTGTMQGVVATYVGTGKLFYDGWSGAIKYKGRVPANLLNGRAQ